MCKFAWSRATTTYCAITDLNRSRKDSRNPNGTLTLRRSSTTPYGNSSQISSQSDLTNTIPPDSIPGQSQQYASQGPEATTDNRYSKSKILEIYRARQNADELGGDVTRLFVNNWDPAQTNGSGGRGWGKSSDGRDHNPGPEICWDQNGQVQPVSLEEMSALEKSVRDHPKLRLEDMLTGFSSLLATSILRSNLHHRLPKIRAHRVLRRMVERHRFHKVLAASA